VATMTIVREARHWQLCQWHDGGDGNGMNVGGGDSNSDEDNGGDGKDDNDWNSSDGNGHSGEKPRMEKIWRWRKGIFLGNMIFEEYWLAHEGRECDTDGNLTVQEMLCWA